jgi:hypothetical protein
MKIKWVVLVLVIAANTWGLYLYFFVYFDSLLTPRERLHAYVVPLFLLGVASALLLIQAFKGGYDDNQG